MIVIQLHVNNTCIFPILVYFSFIIIIFLFAELTSTSTLNQMTVVNLYAVSSWWGKRMVPGT